MKKIKMLLFAATFCAVGYMGCTACQTATMTDADTIKIDYGKIEDVVSLDELLSNEVYLVALGGADEDIIGDISSIQITNNCILVLDETCHAILKFDYEGKLIDKIAKKGRARGEYFNITDFKVVGNDVYILDHMSSKLIVYNFDTFAFEREYKFRDESGVNAWGNQLACMGDRLFLINNKSETSHGYYYIYEFANGEFVPSLPFNKKESDLGWSLDRYYSTTEGELTLFFPPFDTIYTVNMNMDINRHYVDFGARKIPISSIKQEKKEALKYAIDNNMIKSVELVNRLNSHITFKFNDSHNTYCALYSFADKKLSLGHYFELKDIGRLPVSNFYCDGGYFISTISAGLFRMLMSDEMLSDRKAAFRVDKYEDQAKALRMRVTEYSNPIVIFSKI